jgi:hypothetical protein
MHLLASLNVRCNEGRDVANRVASTFLLGGFPFLTQRARVLAVGLFKQAEGEMERVSFTITVFRQF